MDKTFPYLGARYKRDKHTGMNFPMFPNLQTMTGLVDTPQMPGMDVQERIEKVRQFIINQKRAIGFETQIASGTGNIQDIKLAGTARMLLGFSFKFFSDLPDEVPTQASLIVNNDNVLTNVYPPSFDPDFMDDEFYWFPRPLSGTDQIKLTLTGQADNTLFSTWFYI